MNIIRKSILKFLIKVGFTQQTIETIYIGIYSKWKQIKRPFIKFINIYLWKIGKMSDIEYSLRKKLLSGDEVFGDNNFYQSYPALNISGERNSLERFNNYGIDKYINKNSEILDIGGNVCFFSLYVSQFVQNIDIIEYNQNLVDIGKILQKHQNIKNVSIEKKDFNAFKTKNKYDVIFSFAVHKWIGIPFEKYLEILHTYLKNDGIIFLESQNLELDPFENNLKKIGHIFELISLENTNEKKGYLRKIAILKKKN